MSKIVVYIHAERAVEGESTDTQRETLHSLLSVKLGELGLTNVHIEIGEVAIGEHSNLT